MAEKYLEQAVITLASAFVENGDVVTSAIPDLTGTLTGLGMHIATLNTSLKLVVERQRAGEEAASMMRQRINELELSCSEAHARLDVLSNTRDGVVSWAVLNPILEDVAKRPEVRALDERCNVIDQKVSLGVSRAEIQPFRSNVTQQIDSIEKRTSATEDKVGTLLKSTFKRLEELKSVTDELLQSHATSQIANENAHTRIKETVNSVTDGFTSQIKLLESSTNDNLGHSIEEVVKCLTKHSQAIEDINTRESRWQENTANVKEVQSLRKDMTTLKREMEESSHKVHEAYSKCLSIAAIAGRSEIGRGEDGQGHITNNKSFSTATGYSQQKAHWDEARSRDIISEATRGVAQTLETQIERVRQDLGDVCATQLPSFQSQLLQMRTIAEDMRKENTKSDTIMKNLLLVLSESNVPLLGKLIDALSAPGMGSDINYLAPSDGKSLMGDYSLAVSILDQFIRASVDPLLRGLTASVTQHQSFLHNEAVEAETERRIQSLLSVRLAAPHGIQHDEEGEQEEPPHATGLTVDMLRLGIEVADSFSAEQRFGSLVRTEGKSAPSQRRGADVMAVEKGGVGYLSGITVGERIIKVNDSPISNAADFITKLRSSLRDQLEKGKVPATARLSLENFDGSRRREVVTEFGN